MLQARLFSIMRRELDIQKLRLSPYCVNNMESVIRQGIARMRVIGADNHPGQALQAEQNLRALVGYLGKCSRDAGTFPALSENDYDSAMRNCPAYWPYSTSG